jgi:SAM-dependent methyltransferase
VVSPLEDVERSNEFDVCAINISMHECRDIDRVTDNVLRALRPEGQFVISDFPFPESPDGLRSPAGRFMSGIQFFEALIGDQLLPTRSFVELLEGHGFRQVDSFDITPVHAVTFGRK